ncbi:MAG: hypothetical protein D6795_04575 [Deltaproteobacteria bacterium]|nr:MAG: hypothetical protein D6795_04575 [Deltaproteobacteria bacterium]
MKRSSMLIHLGLTVARVFLRRMFRKGWQEESWKMELLRRSMVAAWEAVSDRERFRSRLRSVPRWSRALRSVCTFDAELAWEGVAPYWMIPTSGSTGSVILYLQREVLAPFDTWRDWIARLTQESRSTTLVVPPWRGDTPRGAEHAPFFEAYRWLLSLGISPRRIVIVENPVRIGVGMPLLHRLRREGHPMPAGAIFLSPFLPPPFPLAEGEEVTGLDACYRHIFRRFGRKWFRESVSGSRWIHALHAVDLSGLPPLLLQIAPRELLLAEPLDRVLPISVENRMMGMIPADRMDDDGFRVWQFIGQHLGGSQEIACAVGRFVRERTEDATGKKCLPFPMAPQGSPAHHSHGS